MILRSRALEAMFEVPGLLQANEKTKTIPVAIVSADVLPWKIEKLMNAAAKDYLTKSLDIPVFLSVLDDWTNRGK